MTQFHDWQSFWQMGGYGFYVWSAYALVFFFLSSTVLRTLNKAKKIKNKQVRKVL